MAHEIAILDDLVTDADSYEEIKKVGILYQKKTVESILAFARVVYTLKQKCDKEEQDFNGYASDFFGLSQSGASQFAKTGQNAEKLVAYAQNLPPSSRTLYELTQLSLTDLDKHINMGDINPNSTVNDIKAIKDTIKDGKKSKKSNDTDNPFSVEAEDSDGNTIDAELVDDEESGQEDQEAPTKSKDNKKMSIIDALAIFDIDMNVVYMEQIQAGKDKELLDKAFHIITGEKL